MIAAGAFFASQRAAAAETADTMIVFDASGSMWGQVGGEAKIALARKAARKVLGTWPAGGKLGVIAYGHRRKGDCADIETLAPLAPADGAALADRIDALNPKGKTPISDSLMLAGEALKGSEGKANVILISDGIETCKGDPCAVAEALKQSGAGFTAFVVGFDIGDPATRAQLQCIAEKTGGAYFDAKDADGLDAALEKASGAAQGQKVETPPPPPEEAPGGNLTLRFSLSEETDPIVTDQPSADLIWSVDPQSGVLTSTNMTTSVLNLTVEPGDYEASLEFGAAKGTAKVTVAADRPSEVNLILDAGIVYPKLVVADGLPAPATVFWELLRTQDQDRIASSWDLAPRLIVNAGSYRLQATVDALPPVSIPLPVAAGDTGPVELKAAAGAIAFTAPGAQYLSFVAADPQTPDIGTFMLSYADANLDSGMRLFAPGTYTVTAEFEGGATAQASVTVTADEVSTVALKRE
jgi:Ca-activated chloride channel family protein